MRHGDTEVLRRRVARLREQAVDVRTLADQLVARTEVVDWSGRAAASMRTRVADRASRLREVATAHDRAADSLLHHLREVDRLEETIAAVQARAERLVAAARTRHDAGRGPAPDPADALLLAFDPPPPGHRDWLDVDLPGL